MGWAEVKRTDLSIRQDIHVLRYFSSFISVSEGKVLHITDPGLSFCPLAKHFYPSLKYIRSDDQASIKNFIKEVIESKIRDFGFFTPARKFISNEKKISYGASEMLRSALRGNCIEAAVTVCDGAGTVITDNPDLVQGIGARMNTLVLTSPIPSVLNRLRSLKAHIVSDAGRIDQVLGVREALGRGYKKIAVTLSGFESNHLPELKQLERERGAEIICLSVCTTGIDSEKIEYIRKFADLVWSCASGEVREKIGRQSLLQLSELIPVFVLTKKGIRFTEAYAEDPVLHKSLQPGKQYLLSNRTGMKGTRMGNLLQYLSEAKLPVSARRKPFFQQKTEKVLLSFS